MLFPLCTLFWPPCPGLGSLPLGGGDVEVGRVPRRLTGPALIVLAMASASLCVVHSVMPQCSCVIDDASSASSNLRTPQ